MPKHFKTETPTKIEFTTGKNIKQSMGPICRI